MKENLKLLGFKAKDVVTGFTGVVTSISFDLYGCVQALLAPECKEGKEGKEYPESRWFDLKRMKALSTSPVMEVPSFANVPGGESLPQFSLQP
jgi:hypothetical protein